MLNGDNNDDEKNKQQQQQLRTCSTLFCTFLCRCFARLRRETSRNFLVYTRFIEEMSYAFLCDVRSFKDRMSKATRRYGAYTSASWLWN